jgi:hypothetical protein
MLIFELGQIPTCMIDNITFLIDEIALLLFFQGFVPRNEFVLHGLDIPVLMHAAFNYPHVDLKPLAYIPI